MVLVPPPIDPGQLTQCRRFEVPTPPAANSVRNFKSKSGTRIIELLVPLLFPKFVSERAEVDHELRKRGTSACRRAMAPMRRGAPLLLIAVGPEPLEVGPQVLDFLRIAHAREGHAS